MNIIRYGFGIEVNVLVWIALTMLKCYTSLFSTNVFLESTLNVIGFEHNVCKLEDKTNYL